MSNYRQGDVALFQIKKLPLTEELKIEKSNILARGEATNATHVIENGVVYEDREGMYVVVDDEGKLVHNRGEGIDGHNTLIIEKGVYRVSIERDFYSRRVLD